MNPNTYTNKSLILQGHSRPIKDIKFSFSGETIFTASNDRNIISWNAENGEKLKTFAHSAAVNIIQTTNDACYLISGDNTGCVYLWDIQGGVLLKKIEQDPTLCVRSISLSTDDMYLLILYAGRAKGAASFMNCYRLQDIIDYTEEESPEIDEVKKSNSLPLSNKSGLMFPGMQSKVNNPVVITETNTKVLPYKSFTCKTSETKYTQGKFASNNKSILVSREDGFLELINFSNGKIITENKFHDDIIFDFDINSEAGLILTASRDGVANVINFDTFQVINKFHPQNPTRNLNACKLAVIENPEYNSVNYNQVVVNSISDVDSIFDLNSNNLNKLPKRQEMIKIDVDNIFRGTSNEDVVRLSSKIKPEITLAIVSGGQDSKLVTTTNQKEGGFEIIIYNALEGVELNNFLTHFGPVNTLAVNKNILASGAEDATVRLYKLENYLFPIDKNK